MDTEVHECVEAVGSGERHYAVLPSYPNYKVRAPRLGRQVVVQRLSFKRRKAALRFAMEVSSSRLGFMA